MWTSALLKHHGETLSVQVTAAYGCLKNPVRRAEFLLQERGGAFWPLGHFPDLMEALLEAQEQAGERSQGQASLGEGIEMGGTDTAQAKGTGYSMEQAQEDFARGWEEGDGIASQRAFWWMLHLDKMMGGHGHA